MLSKAVYAFASGDVRLVMSRRPPQYSKGSAMFSWVHSRFGKGQVGSEIVVYATEPTEADLEELASQAFSRGLERGWYDVGELEVGYQKLGGRALGVRKSRVGRLEEAAAKANPPARESPAKVAKRNPPAPKSPRPSSRSSSDKANPPGRGPADPVIWEGKGASAGWALYQGSCGAVRVIQRGGTAARPIWVESDPSKAPAPVRRALAMATGGPAKANPPKKRRRTVSLRPGPTKSRKGPARCASGRFVAGTRARAGRR